MTGQGRNFYYIWPVGRRYILILRKRVQCQNWTAVKKQTNKPALDGICQDCCIPRKTRLQLREREVNRGREMGFQRAVKLFLSLFSYPRGKKKEKRKNLASVYRMSLSISSSMRFDIVSIIYARLGKELGPWSARLINDFRGHSPLSLSLSAAAATLYTTQCYLIGSHQFPRRELLREVRTSSSLFYARVRVRFSDSSFFLLLLLSTDWSANTETDRGAKQKEASLREMQVIASRGSPSRHPVCLCVDSSVSIFLSLACTPPPPPSYLYLFVVLGGHFTPFVRHSPSLKCRDGKGHIFSSPSRGRHSLELIQLCLYILTG